MILMLYKIWTALVFRSAAAANHVMEMVVEISCID